MTPEQIILVQRSFAAIAPIADTAAALFYQRLFELDPSLRPMFRGPIDEQGRKLMAVLALVVNGLSRLEALLPAVQALGRRHAGYGVQPGHYVTVGTALLWTLEQGLGAGFTSEVAAAWEAAYLVLAAAMQAAGRTEAIAA
jgi:hemoglobin-like flavoprotein